MSANTLPPDVRVLLDDLKARVRELERQPSSTGSSTVSELPPGSILGWLGATAPAGFLVCDGQSTAGFPKLIAALVLAGEPSTNVPDLRDMFLVGAGTTYTVGDTGGEAAHILTAGELAAHSHAISATRFTTAAHTHSNQAGLLAEAPDPPDPGAAAASVTDSTGAGDPHENRPPYFAVTWIIKHS